MRTGLASGTVPVASQLPVYEELAGDGQRGLLFPPGDAITFAGQLERLIAEPRLRRELARGGPDSVRAWGEVTDQVEGIYRRLSARRHPAEGDTAVRRRISGRSRLFVDLHMHMPAGWTLGRAAALRTSVEQALMSAVPGLRATIQLLPSDVEAHYDDEKDLI